MPPDKKSKFASLREDLLSHKTVSLKSMQKFVGKKIVAQFFPDCVIIKNHLRLSARTKLSREFRVRKVQNILHTHFFMFILLISNDMVFLVHFGKLFALVSFSKSEIALAEAARAMSAFLKNSLMQINSKMTLIPYDYLYKLHSAQFNYHYKS